MHGGTFVVGHPIATYRRKNLYVTASVILLSHHLRRAIDALGTALKGSGRPLVTTFGLMGLADSTMRAARLATENDAPAEGAPGIARAKTEEVVEAFTPLASVDAVCPFRSGMAPGHALRAARAGQVVVPRLKKGWGCGDVHNAD